MATCLITDVTSEDGCCQSQFMLRRSYRGVSLLCRSAPSDTVGERMRSLDIPDDAGLVDGDLGDLPRSIPALQTYKL